MCPAGPVPEAVGQPEDQQGWRRGVEPQLTQRLGVQVEGGRLQPVLQLANHSVGGGPGDGGQHQRRGPERRLVGGLEGSGGGGGVYCCRAEGGGCCGRGRGLTSRLGKTLSCLFPKAPPYTVKSSRLICSAATDTHSE